MSELPCFGCKGAPRAKGQSYCRPCASARARASYRRLSTGRRENQRTRRAGRHDRWQQFLIALCLAAAYQSGYRAGVGDRALALVTQKAAAREAVREAEARWEDRRRLTA